MQQLLRIQDALASDLVDGLLRTHPNDLTTIPDSWTSWWTWAAKTSSALQLAEDDALPWVRILNYYCAKLGITPAESEDDIPEEIKNLIDTVCELSLDRTPMTLHVPNIQASAVGMSPKKSHEVFRMTAYIASVIRERGIDPSAACIVDVGAGQGYLTRTLQVHLRCRGILALDADDAQTAGAKKWEKKLGIEDAVTHRTIWITPSNLLDTIDDWIASMRHSEDDVEAIPVFLIALHACGSLTPTILRTFVSATRRQYSNEVSPQTAGAPRPWRPAGLVSVGCCYNLLRPEDFPMSATLCDHRRNAAPPAPALPASAFHLATQIPGTWLRTPGARADATLAVRKIVWRALLAREFSLRAAPCERAPDDQGAPSGERASDLRKSCLGTEGTGLKPEMQRLGKLNKKFYDNWGEFVAAAAAKMGFAPAEGRLAQDAAARRALERQLSVLHTLRCIIGPLVESLIVLDRQAWLVEQLNGRHRGGPADGPGVDSGAHCAAGGAHAGLGPVTVAIENLFDQATGSGRNMAITALPSS